MSDVQKTRIIHLVDDLGIGGAQKVVLDICSSADLDRYDVSIFALRGKRELLESYDLDPRVDIRFFEVPLDPDFSLTAYLKRSMYHKASSAGLEPLLSEASRKEPDIVHLHLVPRDLNIGILIQEVAGGLLVYTQHLTNFRTASVATKIAGLVLRRTYRRYHLIAVSETIVREISRHGLRGRDKSLHLIENKLNLARCRPGPRPANAELRIVYVARIGFPKGHDDLIDSWKILVTEPTPKKLVLVGPDAMDGTMQRLARDLGLTASIEFLGARHDVIDILSQSDIAVFPSHQEGLPLALLEKMAMELPVVVSDIPQLTAIIRHGENGLVFTTGDAADMAEKIKILIADPALRRRLGAAARKTVESHFGSNNIARPTEAVYEELLKRRQ